MPFLAHEEKLAFTTGWYTETARPFRTRTLHVSKARAEDWSCLFDGVVRIDWAGNHGLVHLLDRRPVRLDTTDWETINQEEPVKKPRRGKRQGQSYDWEWRWGKWERKWL